MYILISVIVRWCIVHNIIDFHGHFTVRGQFLVPAGGARCMNVLRTIVGDKVYYTAYILVILHCRNLVSCSVHHPKEVIKQTK